jgi:hypothetical protein
MQTAAILRNRKATFKKERGRHLQNSCRLRFMFNKHKAVNGRDSNLQLTRPGNRFSEIAIC